MIEFRLLAVNPLMRRAKISAIYAQVGTLLAPGSKLLELYVDLSDAVLHDCPPITRYCISVREPLWLRELPIAKDEEAEVGALLAVFTRTADEPVSQAVARAARVAVTSVFAEADWWDEPAVG